MKAKKSFWTSITGGVTSAAPILLSCCKSGACVGVCASPVASLFGVSSASIASSPLVSALEPLLIAASAVSFTISYYSLYVLPKLNCNTPGSCACEPTAKEKRRVKINKAVFWIGLMLSIGFLSYFEITKYQQATASAETEGSPSGCTPGECSDVAETDSTATCDSTSTCCSSNNISTIELVCKLTSSELRERNETVIAELKTLVLEKKELENGYSFKFSGNDKMIDLLTDFVKSERECCDFFVFNINVKNKETIWFDITGPEGAKDFISTEMEL
ncbi:MAG: hypothetical protein K0S33_1230 [Bacteroidetes bacterium]|jgi:hypothetical protein|nr:hypothetical protein [Bacteroidota bacterium]